MWLPVGGWHSWGQVSRRARENSGPLVFGCLVFSGLIFLSGLRRFVFQRRRWPSAPRYSGRNLYRHGHGHGGRADACTDPHPYGYELIWGRCLKRRPNFSSSCRDVACCVSFSLAQFVVHAGREAELRLYQRMRFW